MIRNLIKIQPSTLRGIDPATIVERAAGRFDALLVTSPDSYPEKWRELADEAHRNGMQILWWDCIGYWNIASHPAGHNIKAVWPEAPRAWVNFGLPAARERIVERAVEILAKIPADGYLVDYCRYPYGTEKNSGGLFTADQVTQVVRELSKVINIPFWAGVANYNTATHHYAQHWHEWLADGLIDRVSVRKYKKPEDLEVFVPGEVDLSDVNICMAVSSPRLGELTRTQVVEYQERAAALGFEHLSLFDWPECERLGYWDLFPTDTLPPEDIERYRITLDVTVEKVV